ncbi:RNA-binding protein 24 [Abeliophyllum distichum]|uniref:RNA-binding protein 24 n=1 Tax=Abeliophyllum distichum TaxID=126358 RepID=A0ABD1ST19_9LAMI
MAYQHYRSPFGDTTFTKVFVGGLAWETPTDLMRRYFEQFGEILEAVIITDKNTGKSKGYGFVTFRDPESANRACADPNPVIDGRKANCNIASMGRPRPSPPRGMQHIPPDYGYPQTVYNPHLQQPQYYHQLYGASSSGVGNPYYYGYSMQGAARGTFSIPQAQRIQGPSYMYYPTQMEGSSPTYPPPPAPRLPLLQSTRHPLSSPTDSQAPPQTSTETEAGPATSGSATS